MGEDKGVGVGAVDGGVGGQILLGGGGVGGREDGVKGGHAGRDVGDVVEEGVVGAGGEVVHCYVEGDGLVWRREGEEVVLGKEKSVVEGGEGVKGGREGKGGGGVVEEVAGYVGVEAIGDGVEEGLGLVVSMIGLRGR